MAEEEPVLTFPGVMRVTRDSAQFPTLPLIVLFKLSVSRLALWLWR